MTGYYSLKMNFRAGLEIFTISSFWEVSGEAGSRGGGYFREGREILG